MRRITAIIILLLIVSCTKEKSPDYSLKKIKDKGFIILGYHGNIAPLIFRNKCKTTGFYKEIIPILESKLNLKIQLKEISHESYLMTELINKNIDMILSNNIYKSDETSFLSSDPLFSLNFSKLHNTKVEKTNSKNSSVISIFSNGSNLKEKFVNFSVASSMDKLLKELKNKKTGTILINEATAQWLYQSHPSQFRIEKTELSSSYSFFFRPDEYKLMEKMNEIISLSLENKKIRTSSVKWFGVQKFENKHF